MMHRYLPLLLCLACQTADPAGGLIGPPGPQGPPGEKGDKGESAPAAKQLHLIVTDTGEDLGLFVASGVAYHERIAATVYYTSAAQLLYPAPDCKGIPMMAHVGGSIRPYAVRSPGGSLYRADARPMKMARVSSMLGGACVNAEANQDAVPYQDTGIPAPKVSLDDLSVELR